MIRRIATRLIQLPLLLFIIYSLTFLMIVAVPGNPFQRDGGRAISPVVEQALRERYGMQDNLAFYGRYLQRLFHGDLGRSLQYENWSCNEIIAASLPVSITVGLTAIAIATLGGVTLGILAAIYRHGACDAFALFVSILGVSVPTFVIGAGLLVLFSVTLPVLPVGTWDSPLDLVRPAVTLSLVPLAYILRLTRLGMIEALQSDYVRTARAKGLSESTVIFRHALPNAMPPVLAYLGPASAAAMTGSFVVERVFNIPGMGLHFVNSVLNRDQMLILACVLVYSAILITLNAVVDVAHAWIDPRIRVGGARA